MSADLEVLDRVASYLAGELTLPGFKEWFVPTTWDGLEDRTVAPHSLSCQILLRLAEHSNGHLGDEQLRAHLAQLLRTFPHALRQEEPRTSTVADSVSSSQRPEALHQSQASDKLFEVGLA